MFVPPPKGDDKPYRITQLRLMTDFNQKIDSLASGFRLRPAHERGMANHGWLTSAHSFSFANYFHPDHMGFANLRVINDDKVMPGRGFGEHPHQNADSLIYAGTFDGDQSAETILPEDHKGWIQLARGSVDVNGQHLEAGDGLAITQGGRLIFSQGRDAEVIYFDLFG